MKNMKPSEDPKPDFELIKIQRQMAQAIDICQNNPKATILMIRNYPLSQAHPELLKFMKYIKEEYPEVTLDIKFLDEILDGKEQKF